MSNRTDPRVSLTTSYLAAEYAACEAVAGDIYCTALIQDITVAGRRIDDTGIISPAEYFARNLDGNLHVAKMVHLALDDEAESRITRAMLNGLHRLADMPTADAVEVGDVPVAITLDGDRMFDLGYPLSRYFDTETEDYKWEEEVACWRAITPLDAVLLGIKVVEPHQLETFIKGRRAFMPMPRRSASLDELRRGFLSHLRRAIEVPSGVHRTHSADNATGDRINPDEERQSVAASAAPACLAQ